MESVYFLGVCTPSGFVSHYDTLLTEVKSLAVIKGGPGCGKSTFMRAVARAALARGHEVSYVLCSSDPNSLDAVILPQLSLAFVDGTAPHVLEPSLCGGGMNYLNFGAFYDSEAMRTNEEEIRLIQQENAAQYPHVTACLAAADRLLDSVRSETDTPTIREETAAIAECLNLSNLQPVSDRSRTTYRFLTALTPKGPHFCAQTPEAVARRVYVLRDSYGLSSLLLPLVLQRAQSLGHECIVCHSPMRPDGVPAHLLIPSAQVAVISENRSFFYDGGCFCRIDLDSTLSPKKRRELEFPLKTATELQHQAVRYLRKAKLLHDRIEQLCRPFVDFSAVDAMTTRTIERLFGGEESSCNPSGNVL